MSYIGRKGQTAPLASADLPTNSISTAHLINDAVTSAKIGVDVIVAEDIAANAITVAEIADDAVTGAKLANDIAISTTGALTGTTGDFNWDSNTLVVDSSESRVGVGTDAPVDLFHVKAGASGQGTPHSYTEFLLESGGHIGINILTPNNKKQQIMFGDPQSVEAGAIVYNHSTEKMGFTVEGSERMTIDSSGNVDMSGGLTVGSGCTASATGVGSAVIGHASTASGDHSFVFGREMTASADYTFGIALNDQNGTNLTTANTMAIMGGRVGIGTVSPTSPLHIATSTETGDSAAKIINTASNPFALYLELGGNNNNTSNYFIGMGDATTWEAFIYSDGSFSQVSDRRLKENIVDVESMLDKVNSLRVVNYNRINDESKALHIGAIAQEVEEIFPHLISLSPAIDAVEEVRDDDGNITTEAVSSKEERLMMYKVGLIFPLIKAVQELSAKVTALENA